MESFVSGKTKFIKRFEYPDYFKEPMTWPMLVICKQPAIKSLAAYITFFAKGESQNFTSEEEFHQLQDEVFFTNPKEVVYAVSASSGVYHQTLGRIKEIPVEEPYVTNVIGDYQYFGVCSCVRLEALKEYMIEKGEIGRNDFDASLSAMVLLQVIK